METREHIRQLFEYDLWANQKTLESLATVPETAERPRKLFSHIVGAQRIWRARFEDPNPPGAEPWPTLTLDEARVAAEELNQSWQALLGRLTPAKLAEDLVYRTTKGTEFHTPIQDVLLHVVMHSAYHRGQVAAAVREAGGKPAATDYVVYLRQASK
jgi:uncharacterized damage-inducible protein DinB